MKIKILHVCILAAVLSFFSSAEAASQFSCTKDPVTNTHSFDIFVKTNGEAKNLETIRFQISNNDKFLNEALDLCKQRATDLTSRLLVPQNKYYGENDLKKWGEKLKFSVVNTLENKYSIKQIETKVGPTLTLAGGNLIQCAYNTEDKKPILRVYAKKKDGTDIILQTLQFNDYNFRNEALDLCTQVEKDWTIRDFGKPRHSRIELPEGMDSVFYPHAYNTRTLTKSGLDWNGNGYNTELDLVGKKIELSVVRILEEKYSIE